MGKSASASPVEKKNEWTKHKTKKKGRPSLLDVERRNLRIQRLQELELEKKQLKPQDQLGGRRKSESPNPSNPNLSPSPARRPSQRSPDWDSAVVEEGSRDDSDDDDGDDDDDDEGRQEGAGRRRQRKLRLVLGLPPNGWRDELGPSSSESEGDGGRETKKRRIEAVNGSAECETEKQRSAPKLTHANPQGEPSASGGLTPLPDEKLLVFILNRLQKKDTYGVFSEPVDPDELPDYQDVIEHPMDFRTIRKKLSCGSYASLEEFEEDVFLVSLNAMRYNAPDTVYFRQARAIQELAKKDFENLRQDSDDSELDSKPVHMAKMFGKDVGINAASRPLADLGGLHTSIDPFPPNNDHHSTVLTSELSVRALQKPQNGSTHAKLDDYKLHKNDESSGLLMKEPATRFSKKNTVSNANHRDTYKQTPAMILALQPSILTTLDEEKKELVTVGVHMENAYAKSLARFAAKFGHIGWEIAVKLIQKSLPFGTKFGRGWVGEKDAPREIRTSVPAKISLPESSTVLFCGPSEVKRSTGKLEISSNFITANKIQTSHMLHFSPAAETVTAKHSKKLEDDVFLKSSHENVLNTGTAVQSKYLVSHPNKQIQPADVDSYPHLGNNHSHAETNITSSRQISKMARRPENYGIHNKSNNSTHPVDRANSLDFSSFRTNVSQLNEQIEKIGGPSTASNSTSNLHSQAMIHMDSEKSRTNYSGTLNSMSSFIRQSSFRHLDTGNANAGKQCATNSVNNFIHPTVTGSFETENPKTNRNHEFRHGDDICSPNTGRLEVDRDGTGNALLQPTANLLFESQPSQLSTFGSMDSRRLLNLAVAAAPAEEERSAASDGRTTNSGNMMNEWAKDSAKRRLHCFSLSQGANSIPPDLNIRFQSPSSPAAAVIVDTQQPDLALQL